MSQFASEAIDRMAHGDRSAIWLQTAQGERWEDGIEHRRESGDTTIDDGPTYNNNGVVDYIVQGTCDLAANWSNPRIREYNERSTMRD